MNLWLWYWLWVARLTAVSVVAIFALYMALGPLAAGLIGAAWLLVVQGAARHRYRGLRLLATLRSGTPYTPKENPS